MSETIELCACPVCQSPVQAISAKHREAVGIAPHSDGVIYRRLDRRTEIQATALERLAEDYTKSDCDLPDDYVALLDALGSDSPHDALRDIAHYWREQAEGARNG